jgi:hypothetical protein
VSAELAEAAEKARSRERRACEALHGAELAVVFPHLLALLRTRHPAAHVAAHGAHFVAWSAPGGELLGEGSSPAAAALAALGGTPEAEALYRAQWAYGCYVWTAAYCDGWVAWGAGPRDDRFMSAWTAPSKAPLVGQTIIGRGSTELEALEDALGRAS